jgi:hypothetical protein
MKSSQTLLLVSLASVLSIYGCAKDPGDEKKDSGDEKKDSGDEKKDSGEQKKDSGIVADTAPPKCINIADDLIADFKTDNKLNPVDGRSGWFFPFGDDSIDAVFDPPKDKDDPSNYPIDTENGNPECSSEKGSFHTKATGFGVWGASVRTNFKPTAKGKDHQETYDASKYKGVSFWAKATTTLTGVMVTFPDVYTDSAADPSAIDPEISACVTSGMLPEFNCSPYLVKLGDGDFPNYADKLIGTTWKRYDIMFADTLQDKYNTGYHRPDADYLDTKHLTMMAIQVNASYVGGSPEPNDFELWIDDIYFIK